LKAKPKRSKIIKDCDKLWSQIVRQRDGECVIKDCHNESAHAHHIFSRKNLSTRFDPKNGITLCYRHHIYFAHSDYEKFRDFLMGWMGPLEFARLKEKANRIEHWKIDELLTIKDQLKRMVDK
jgi:hypothetical protein